MACILLSLKDFKKFPLFLNKLVCFLVLDVNLKEVGLLFWLLWGCFFRGAPV